MSNIYAILHILINITSKGEHKLQQTDDKKPRVKKPMSDETKAKISASKKGRVQSEKTKQKIRQSSFGKEISDDTKLLLSDQRTTIVKKLLIQALRAIYTTPIDEIVGVKLPEIPLQYAAVHSLASTGVSHPAICALLGLNTQDQQVIDVFTQGRATLAVRNRMALLHQAQTGNLNAAIYLDKMISGDVEQHHITVDETPRQLKEVDTNKLLELLSVITTQQPD